MILVFSFLSLVAIILTMLLLLVLSNIQIELINLNIFLKTLKSEYWKLDDNISIKFKLYLLNKIPILKLKLTKDKLEKFNILEKIKQLDIKKIRKDYKIDKDILKDLKLIKAKILKINLDINLGTEDVLVTSYIIAFISTFISILLASLIKEINPQKHNYKVTPIYENKNILKVKFNCIINVKIGHIIHIIYNIFRKRRVDINGKASNRGPYGYSYE